MEMISWANASSARRSPGRRRGASVGAPVAEDGMTVAFHYGVGRVSGARGADCRGLRPDAYNGAPGRCRDGCDGGLSSGFGLGSVLVEEAAYVLGGGGVGPPH